jgi:two-component system, OmpR family, phosphate regulon sensor histidine kinase PhoR
MRVSLRWKFSLLLAGLLLFTVSVLSVLVLRSIRHNQRIGLEREMAEMANRAELTVKMSYLSGERVSLKAFMRYRGMDLSNRLGQSNGLHVRLYDETGVEIGNSLPLVSSPTLPDTLQYALQGKIAYSDVHDVLYYFAPITFEEQLIAVVEFQRPVGELHAFYRQTRIMFLLSGSTVLLASFLLGFLYVYRQSKAITLLKQTANNIGAGAYIDHPPLVRTDELGDLSKGIYRMSREIESSMKKLEAEKAKLQVLEQQQKQFINNISHELKTPLTSITAYADLLELYPDDPLLLQQALESIRKESSRLHDLVENALRLASLEKYEFEYQAEAVSLDNVLDELVSLMKGKADKFGLTFQLHTVPATIWAEPESLIHIFVNLLDNAIKYNVPGGSVNIRLYTEQNHARVEIVDTGIGIPTESQERIFEPFYTANKARSRETKGSGLGLTLVQQWVEKQRGIIQLKRSDSTGSVFEVQFPLYHHDSV